MGKSKNIKYNKNYQSNNKYRQRKREKKRPKKFVDTKGDWEAGFYQTLFIKDEEQRIKKGLCPRGCFDANKINDMRFPKETHIDKILKKVNSSENIKLNSIELTRYNAYLSKSSSEILKDMKSLEKDRFAKVITKEGKAKATIDHIRYFLENEEYVKSYVFDMRIKNCTLTEELSLEYNNLLPDIDRNIYYSDTIDVHELQFMKLHRFMPPLGKKGFHKLDDFQLETVEAIDEGLDCIVCAPTSSGKSVLSGYLLTKGYKRILIIVPTTPLAWQLDSYATEVYGDDIPIVTKSYKSIPRRDELIDLVMQRSGLVGTSDAVLDLLPMLIKRGIHFDAIIVDEVHMLGNSDCSDMELVLKYLMGKKNKPQLLCLSATIGNIDYLKQWIEKISSSKSNVKIINCNKRFFNLQKFYYQIDNNSKSNGITKRIHPLSMVSVNEFIDGSILNKNLYPTPPDTWNLYKKVKKIKLDLGEKDPYIRFEKKHCITLDESNELFNDLLKLLVDNISNDNVINMLNDFTDKSFGRTSPRPVDIAFTLKNENKCPSLFFIKDSARCKRVAKKFSDDIIKMQDDKYPNYYKEKLKKIKNNKNYMKKMDKKATSQKNYGHDFDKKKKKEMMKEIDIDDKIEEVSLNEPHLEFILNNDQKIRENRIESWANELNKHFHKQGESYNYVIDLLWRGVGVYATGLPDPYLRLVQKLASQGDLALVISDKQLVFGVSMPFRSVVIYDDDDLDPLWVKQMEGRAGRRGLDTEGCVIYAGFSWDRVKELSVSKIPDIECNDTRIYTLDHAIELSKDEDWNNIKINNFDINISDEESIEHYDDIKDNLQNGWNFVIRRLSPYYDYKGYGDYVKNFSGEKKNIIKQNEFDNIRKIDNDKNNFNYMMWRLRNSDYCYIIAFLINPLEKCFSNCEPKEKKNQILLAKFLLKYILNYDIEETKENKLLGNILEYSEEYLSNLRDSMEEMGLEVSKYSDIILFNSIRDNKISNQNSDEETDNLRERLLKFAEILIIIQHYFRHSRKKTMTILFSKLITRFRHMYNDSSPF